MENQALIQARQERGLTQRQLGTLIGVKAKTIAAWEHGQRSPLLLYRSPLAHYLGKTLRELGFTSEEDPQDQKNAQPLTWRDFLSELIEEPAECARIANEVGVKPETIKNWASRNTMPHLTHIRLLLKSITPQNKSRFESLLERDYYEIAKKPLILPEIPAAFYDNIIGIYTHGSPTLRSSAIRLAIFQQMLSQFDPLQSGLQVVVCLCVPPRTDEKIYSLRFLQGKATAPWERETMSYMTFLGLESQMGNTVIHAIPLVTQTAREHNNLYPAHKVPFVNSIASHPLILFDRVAGAISCFSAQEHYFSAIHMDILKSYAELFVLSLKEEQFYPLHKIKLGIMPPSVVQQPYLRTFQSRVLALTIKSKGQYPREHEEAEYLAWKEIETELLHLAAVTG